MIKKLAQCVGICLYSIISAYLLWLIFYWITPFVMSIGWLGFILYCIFATGLCSGFISLANMVLAIPTHFLTKDNIVAKIINALPMLFFGYSTICLPWKLNIEYGLLQWILAISLSSIAFSAFWAMILIAFSNNEK